MNRQKLFLIILLGILAAAIGYAFWKSPRLERVTKPLQQRIKHPESPQAGAFPLEGLHVRLDLLKRKAKAYTGYKRNIFGPAFVKPPQLPAPPPEKVVVPAVKPPVVPPQEVKKPVPRFTFLGFLELGLERTVFLSLKNEIFVVKKGKPFGKNKEFQVVDLTHEKLEIRQGDDPRTITISLVDPASKIPLNGNREKMNRANGIGLNN